MNTKPVKTIFSKTIVDRTALFDSFLAEKPELHTNTLHWRIHALKRQGVLEPVSKGKYTLQPKAKFQPPISPATRQILSKLKKRLEGVRACITDSEWLNAFSSHQAMTRLTIVEVEKDYLETTFHTLREAGVKSIFLKPDAREMELYILSCKHAVIVMPLVSRAPQRPASHQNEQISFPSLEKLLTDLFSEHSIFYFWGGDETKTIFRNAASRHAINFTTMLSYAGRRGKQPELRTFLKEVLGNDFEELNL